MLKQTEEDVLLQDITEDERQAALREFREREEIASDVAERTDV
jgi:hypothetical protein